jgi:hypothetical protein
MNAAKRAGQLRQPVVEFDLVRFFFIACLEASDMPLVLAIGVGLGADQV